MTRATAWVIRNVAPATLTVHIVTEHIVRVTTTTTVPLEYYYNYSNTV